MYTIKVVIPNLVKRDDRYLFSLGWHMGRGFPSHSIRRHFAHDGCHYSTVIDIVNHVRYGYIERMPCYGNGRFLLKNHEGWDVYTYAWMWTWYEIINAIALEPDHMQPTLFLIDDWVMNYDYQTVCGHAQTLSQMNDPFAMLQYVHGTSESASWPSRRNNERTAITTIQHGIAGTGDPAILMSPLGARRLVEFADEHPEHSPEILMWDFAIRADNSGCYSSLEDGASLPHSRINVYQDRSAATGGKHVIYGNDDPHPGI